MSRDLWYRNPKFKCSSIPSETPKEKCDRKIREVLEEAKAAGVRTLIEDVHAKEVSSLNDKIDRGDRTLREKDQELAAKKQELAAKKQELAAKKQELTAKKQELAAKKQELADKNQIISELEGFNNKRTDDVVEKTHELRKTSNTEIRYLYSPNDKEYANRIAEIAETIPHKESIDELGNWTVSIELGGDTYNICNSIEKIDGYNAIDYKELEPWRKNGKYAQYIDQKCGEGFHISASKEFTDLLEKIGLQTGIDKQQDQYRILSYLAGGLGALYLLEENGKSYQDCSSYNPGFGKICEYGVDYRESGGGQHLLIKKGELEKKGGENSLSKFVEYPGFSEKSGQEQVKIFVDIMKSEKLVDVTEKGDFYEISINIPGQGIKNMLITKGTFDTINRIENEKNVECHEKAESMGFDQMSKADVFGLSKRLLKLFDKLGDNEVKDRIEDVDGWTNSTRGNSIWAFFVRFIHDVMHDSVDCADYNFSCLWLKDIGSNGTGRGSVSNWALTRYRSEYQKLDGMPDGGLSGEDGHFLYKR